MVIQGMAGKVAVIVGSAVIAGGVAASAATPAKIPDSSTGKITSCVTKKTGEVRFINAQAGKKCKKSEKKVVFNQTGPQGQPGTNGISEALVAHRDDTKTLNQMQVGPNTVLTLALPAGSYVVSANSSVKATTASTTISCSLISGTGTVTQTTSANATEDLQGVSLTGTYVSTSAGSVGFLCQPSGPAFPAVGLGEAQGATIVATKVNAISAG